MKVLVITGSPHKNGTSALLAEKFIRIFDRLFYNIKIIALANVFFKCIA